MKFKLDENLSPTLAEIFIAVSHDAHSVVAQLRGGQSDDRVIDDCVREGRALRTLDLDFANPIRFDPRPTAGVAVLRLSRNPAPTELAASVSMLLSGL